LTRHRQGEIVDGKYEVLGRLGAGGMGEVYKVRHVHLEEPRVIKFLRQDLATDPAAAQRFVHEARTATSIKHPNLAILYDFSKLADGSFYMVWEFIEGEDLGKLLRERGPLPVALAVELGMQALAGLDALHAAGVVHRDVSPDNFMITRTQRGQPLLKIIDLGLAKNLSAESGMEITQAGMFLGKMRYCSPEQAGRGGEQIALDRRSDLYSCAAVLYEAVCGLPPFESETPHGFVLKRLTEDPLPLVGRNPKIQVPEELDAVLRRGLERDRERRFPDAQSFIRALQRIAERLRGAATVEVKLNNMAAAARPATRPAAPAMPDIDRLMAQATAPPKPTPAPTPAPRPTATPAPGSSPGVRRATGELSRAERDDLLAQIERAAKKAEESNTLLQQAADPLRQGAVEEARGYVEQAKAQNPRQKGLAEVEAQVAEIEGRLERGKQIKRTEEMLESYLKAGQPQLARFALETLLDVAPEHPRAAELRERVEGLAGELENKKRAQEVLATGRGAVLKGNFAEALRQLDTLTRLDRSGTLAEELRGEIDRASKARQQAEEADSERQRMEELLEAGDLAAAERQLDTLSRLGVAKVALDLYRARLADGKRKAEAEAQAEEFARRARERANLGDFAGAREIALEFERAQPASQRPGALFLELNHIQEEVRKRQGIEQGVRQLEGFLASRKLAEAELAFKILVQMAPQHPRRQELQRALAALRGG
jgi:tRNA A-37 threonylcarbamoyl transferase component Bud32